MSTASGMQRKWILLVSALCLSAGLAACALPAALPGASSPTPAPTLPGGTLFSRLAGLWTGEAAQTPLGTFPVLFMDFRAADDNWLFGRVDLDSANNLRFGFTIEDLAGQPTVVYRNGGYFQGNLRDMTMELVDSDEQTGSYHFCAVVNGCLYFNGACIQEAGGCGFVDALFTFNGADQLTFDAHVNGAQHEVWTATRESARTIPSPFPASTPLPSTTDWPVMPTLAVEVSWPEPLSQATNIWVILADSSCATFACDPERAIFTSAPAGSTSAAVTFEQIFSGSYYAVGLVDSTGSFETTLQPGPGDGVSDPSATITVPSTGAGSASLPIVYTVP